MGYKETQEGSNKWSKTTEHGKWPIEISLPSGVNIMWVLDGGTLTLAGDYGINNVVYILHINMHDCLW